jgi:uncharacterized protein YhbP (UPF0306 family)
MKRNLSGPTPLPRDPSPQELSDSELRKRAEEILGQQRIVTLSINDDEGPWAAPVFFAQEGFDLYFVSNPLSRHGRAAAGHPECAAAVFNANSEWRKVQGLQMEGALKLLDEDEGKHALKTYTRKFPFTGVFFSQQQNLPEPLRVKVSDVRFYRFRARRIVLVDNTVRFGFHHTIIL